MWRGWLLDAVCISSAPRWPHQNSYPSAILQHVPPPIPSSYKCHRINHIHMFISSTRTYGMSPSSSSPLLHPRLARTAHSSPSICPELSSFAIQFHTLATYGPSRSQPRPRKQSPSHRKGTVARIQGRPSPKNSMPRSQPKAASPDRPRKNALLEPPPESRRPERSPTYRPLLTGCALRHKSLPQSLSKPTV